MDQIGFLLGRVYYSYLGLLERWLDAAGLAGRLKPGMGSLLFALFEQDDRTITEISRELQLAKSTMTAMVARMRKAGLLTVAPDDDDARATRLRLTTVARALEPRCRRVAARMERLLCGGFTRSQQSRFRNDLRRINRTMLLEITPGASPRRHDRRTREKPRKPTC